MMTPQVQSMFTCESLSIKGLISVVIVCYENLIVRWIFSRLSVFQGVSTILRFCFTLPILSLVHRNPHKFVLGFKHLKVIQYNYILSKHIFLLRYLSGDLFGAYFLLTTKGFPKQLFAVAYLLYQALERSLFAFTP